MRVAGCERVGNVANLSRQPMGLNEFVCRDASKSKPLHSKISQKMGRSAGARHVPRLGCVSGQQQHRHRKAVSLKDAAVVSDGYFTFADGVDVLGRKKVKAIFAPHGSAHDKEVAQHAKSFEELIFHTVPGHVGRVFAGG